MQTGSSSRRRDALPFRLTKKGASLLNLQCWLWGQDIRRREGNLLLAAGMNRLRPPADVSGCSQYSVRVGSGFTLKLWGFGIYCGREEGCYLNRYEFVPRKAVQQDCWTAHFFANASRTIELAGLPEAFRWIAAYEAAVVASAGPTYRLISAEGGPEISTSPLGLGAAWCDLAEEIERWALLKAGKSLTGSAQRQVLQSPDRKNSWDLTRNPPGTLPLKFTVQPSSSNILSQLSQWK